jgi:hypothetical protein
MNHFFRGAFLNGHCGKEWDGEPKIKNSNEKMFQFILISIIPQHLKRTQVDSCNDVPIILPEVRLLNITRFVVGRPGQVHLRLKSSYPLEFLWFKNILKEHHSYPAIIVGR